MKKFIFISIALIFNLPFINLSSFNSLAFAESPLRVGVILPLTGDAAFWGDNTKKGIELALRDLKEKESNTLLSVRYLDDQCSPKEAVSAFRNLVDIDHVSIIFGPACSSSTAALVPLAEREKVLIVAFSESDQIRTGPYVLRLWVPNGAQGRLLAHYAYKQGLQKISILSVQNAFGAALSKAFKEEFIKLGGKIMGHNEYLLDSYSFRSELSKLKASKPDGIFFASYIADGSAIVREIKQLGISAKLLGPSTINSPEFYSAVGNAAEGLVFADLADVTSEEFRARWSKEFGAVYPGIQSGAPLFYDLTTILGRIYRENLQDLSNVQEQLRRLNYSSGVSGGLQFTKSGDLDRQHLLFEIKGGRPKEISK